MAEREVFALEYNLVDHGIYCFVSGIGLGVFVVGALSASRVVSRGGVFGLWRNKTLVYRMALGTYRHRTPLRGAFVPFCVKKHRMGWGSSRLTGSATADSTRLSRGGL